uniref:Mucin n=1 Tax=Rhipicephalus appendiculatus TaxID=34631 RepID=A0A131YL79_RHIAP
MAAVAETSGLKSLESDTSVPKSTVDDDDDELEALRTAALLSMKVREKRKSTAVNSEARERSGSYSTYSRFHHSNQRATTPGKPLFSWNQHTRPNLIVIQPVPLEGSEAASPCSATSIQTVQPSTKLVLPQDRWCPKQGQESPASSGTGQSKRRASGKFSHFESSSESEESDDDDLLRSGSASSHSDASVDGHSSDDEQNSTQASPSCRFAQDCLDSCLSESTSDLPAFSSPQPEVTSEAGAISSVNSVHKSSDECSPAHAVERGCNVVTVNAIASAQLQAGGNSLGKCATKDNLGLVSRTEASVHIGHEKTTVVPNENAPEVLFDYSGLHLQNSGNASPVRHATRKSPAIEEHQQKHDEGRLINGLSSDGRRPLHLSPDNMREDRLVPPPRERHSSREGTPGSTRSVDSQDRSASSVFEARRRKFECTVPVNPVGGKILLLRQGRTEDQSPHREGSSPLSSPSARTRSRSRSLSPPLLRSVLSVVKRGPSEVSPACVESKKHRSGRTVEVIVHSVGEEATDASERVGNSSGSKLPVHLRLGDASTASSTRKKKSKRKRSSHDSAAYSVKRKHARARGLDSDVRRVWLGRDQRCNRRKRMPSGLSDGAP